MAILAIDQGTTGTTCILYDEAGRPLGRSYRELTQHYPHEGWVEHDPEEIWQGVVASIGELLKGYSGPVAAVGITNQRETTILWERSTGRPLHNAVVWQCRRTSELCRRYEAEREEIARKTGLPVDPYFSATKIRWLLDAYPEADPANLLFGTVDSWLVWKLTGGRLHATDCTNASRTLLYDIGARRWDEGLLNLFGVPAAMLPEVRGSVDGFGSVETIDALRGVPIAAIAGDQQAALFGQCCFEPGTLKNTYGTGCFMVMNTGRERILSSSGLLATLALDAKGEACYALEGSVFMGGAVVQWLRDGLGLLSSAAESEAMALEAGTNAGVYIVPAFTGLGAPHWQADARGTITGLTRGAGRSHMVRAGLESIAYQSFDIFTAMQADTGMAPDSLTVDGGAVGNNFLMQFQADLLGIPLKRPANIESTSLGAAFLAGLHCGIWKGPDELLPLRSIEKLYQPSMGDRERTELLAGWRRALRQALAT